MVQWIYSHLMMYSEEGGKVVELTYHTIDFKGRTYTELIYKGKMPQVPDM